MSETVINMTTKGKSRWEKNLIDLSQPVSPPEPLLIDSASGNALLFQRGIHVSSGKQKAGKTFYNTIIMAALTNLQGGYCGLKPSSPDLKVLFVDTEQDVSDTQEVVKRVHSINGWKKDNNVPRFRALNLREYTPEERIKIIEEALPEFHPNILIIDGIVDLCLDFNSLDESHALVTKFMQWTSKYNVAIVTSLHLNKTNDELRGHLGAFLSQKADSVVVISKEDDGNPYMKCSVTNSRHRPIEDFSFRIENGLPVFYEQIGNERKNSVNLFDLFNSIISAPTSYTDLVAKVVAFSDKSERYAKAYIKKALESGIIKQGKNGKYEHNLPF